MGVTTYYKEAESPVQRTRLFKAISLDSHNLFPKLLPGSIKSIQFVEGDHATVGSIKLVTFGEGKGYVKYRIDEFDAENFYVKLTTIEGDMLGDKVECIVNEAKYEVSASGGTICKSTTTFHTKGDAALDEVKVNMGYEMKMKMFKAVEEYLMANPQAYA